MTHLLNKAIQEAISQLETGEHLEKKAKQIFHIKDNYLFIWSRKHSHILAVNLGKEHEESSPIQTISLTDAPLFEVDRIVSSQTGRWLCLHGERGISVVELPHRSGKSGSFRGGEPDLSARSFSIAERFFMCNPKLIVQQALFHPGSIFDSHLVVLSTDNYIRIYNVNEDFQTPELSIPLTSSSSSFFGNASLSVRASIGEAVVGFAFAPPVTEEGKEDVYDSEWPIFVLQGNGDVYCLVTGLSSGSSHRILGPIQMYPETMDNYGVDSCAILCLHPQISSPPLLVIATCGGTIYHCVVLTRGATTEDDETSSMISDWSTAFSNVDGPCELSLFVYESVELELGFASSSSPDRPVDYPILLHSDPSTPARYFCTHDAGVHSVGLPMVRQLAEMAQAGDKDCVIPAAEEECVVEHLVCTQITSTSEPAPILGLAITGPPPRLLCLLNNFQVEDLTLTSLHFTSPPPLLTSAAKGEEYQSPLKKLHKEPFDQHMRRLLQRNTTHPLMKAGAGTDLSSQECLDLLTRSIQVLRDEHLNKLDQVRSEIERRASSLRVQKQSQQSSMSRLASERLQLRETAASIAERYEDLRDNGERLTGRIEIVLRKIQRQMPMSSDKEIRMQRELKDIERKTKDLQDLMEQIRAKEKYQWRQITQTRQNMNQKAVSALGMGDNQLQSIKEVLQQDGKDISVLVRSLQEAKKDLAV